MRGLLGLGSWTAAALAAALTLGPSAPAAEMRIARKPEFTERVNAAIDRGVQWLRGAQQPGGAFREHPAFPGATTALAYYTLRVCGVPQDDAAARSAFEAMRSLRAGARKDGSLKTYTAGLTCMAIAEHGTPTASADRAGERLVTLGKDDAAWMQEIVKHLEDGQDDAGRWSYADFDAPKGRRAYDNSNTQYALLGLKAASRAGAKVRSVTWKRALGHFLEAQDDDGPAVPRFEPAESGRTTARPTDHARGWDYTANGASYGSMTAGGVGSIVICRSEMLAGGGLPPGLDAKSEQAARDGIAWLGRHFSVQTNPGGGKGGMHGWHYYFLYALERAGVLAAVEWTGAHDWYGEGAEFLLGAQLPGGAWTEDPSGRQRGGLLAGPAPADDANTLVATCFALLFLKKGTAPVARGALTKSSDENDINFDAARALGDDDFDDFVDLVLSRWRRATTDDAKERLLGKAASVGPRLVPPLVLRLASTKAAEREAAIAALRRATGLDHGYDPGAAPEAREDAVLRWQGWWLANEKQLRFDEASGRIAAK